MKEVTAAGRSVTVKADNAKGEEVTFKAEYCLVSVGRRPYTDGLNLEAAGLSTDERGRVAWTPTCARPCPTSTPLATWCAARCWHTSGRGRRVRRRNHRGTAPTSTTTSSPTWSTPGLKWRVGATEEQLKADGVAYKAAASLQSSGRARASMDTDGMVKVLAHAETDEIWACTCVAHVPRT